VIDLYTASTPHGWNASRQRIEVRNVDEAKLASQARKMPV